MQVDIWIITRFSGKFSNGSGEYGIMLEAKVNDLPVRKIHCTGWEDISYQRLQVRALVDAIGRMTKPADVVIHIDSVYASYVAGNEAEVKAHTDLWQQFIEKSKRMISCRVIREIDETYKAAILKELEKHQFRMRKDK